MNPLRERIAVYMASEPGSGSGQITELGNYMLTTHDVELGIREEKEWRNGGPSAYIVGDPKTVRTTKLLDTEYIIRYRFGDDLQSVVIKWMEGDAKAEMDRRYTKVCPHCYEPI